jgi:hypothetical protein
VHSPQQLTASFVTASYDEVTDRHPCQLVGGEPYVNALFQHVDGVAEILLVRCADCGQYVTERRLSKLLVFEGRKMTILRLPMVPMHDHPRGEA